MKFRHFWPSWKSLSGYLGKNPLVELPGKNPSDAHAYARCGFISDIFIFRQYLQLQRYMKLVLVRLW